MSASDEVEFTGSCLCGAVRFSGTRVAEPGIAACHCGQCRKWSGHVWSAFGAETLTIQPTPHLRWYRSSDKAQRGFCDQCGSSLFWQADDRPLAEVAAGTLDGPTGLHLQRHIFVADKGDYYDIADGLPQDPRAS